MRKFLAFCTVLALTGPALSAQFFIVQDATTKRCAVVEQVPGNADILGDGAYGDRPSAEADMAKIGACSPQTTGSNAAPATGSSPTPATGSSPATGSAPAPAETTPPAR